MFPIPLSRRKALAASLALAGALALGSCGPMPVTSSGPALGEGAVQVALLVPSAAEGSGDALIARNLEQAARLAIADLQGVEIDLRVYETGSGAASAGQVASRAADEGARIILGPVYSEAATGAGVAVRGKGINVLSFSNNTDVAGGNVFVLGQTFQNSANRLMRFAASQGKRRALAVYDQTPSGEAGLRAIRGAAANAGVTVAGEASYEFSQQGIVNAASGIVAQARSTAADAVIFTADPAGALPLLTQLLPEAGLDKEATRFIGLARWDTPSTVLSLPGVQGGWFALPDPGLTGQFEARYLGAYGESPLMPMAGLAYDGIAAIGALVRTGNANALSGAALTQGSGFAGVNGVFRFRSDGTIERGLAVAQVQNGQVVILDPAPRSFGGPGL
jgi:hypothetical protein